MLETYLPGDPAHLFPRYVKLLLGFLGLFLKSSVYSVAFLSYLPLGSWTLWWLLSLLLTIFTFSTNSSLFVSNKSRRASLLACLSTICLKKLSPMYFKNSQDCLCTAAVPRCHCNWSPPWESGSVIWKLLSVILKRQCPPLPPDSVALLKRIRTYERWFKGAWLV